VKEQLANQEKKQEEFKRILEEQQTEEDLKNENDSDDNPIYAVLNK